MISSNELMLLFSSVVVLSRNVSTNFINHAGLRVCYWCSGQRWHVQALVAPRRIRPTARLESLWKVLWNHVHQLHYGCCGVSGLGAVSCCLPSVRLQRRIFRLLAVRPRALVVRAGRRPLDELLLVTSRTVSMQPDSFICHVYCCSHLLYFYTA